MRVVNLLEGEYEEKKVAVAHWRDDHIAEKRLAVAAIQPQSDMGLDCLAESVFQLGDGLALRHRPMQEGALARPLHDLVALEARELTERLVAVDDGLVQLSLAIGNHEEAICEKEIIT